MRVPLTHALIYVLIHALALTAMAQDAEPKFIDGAIVFPLQEVTDKYPQIPKPKDTPIRTLPQQLAYPEIAQDTAEDFAQYVLESVQAFELPGIAFAVVQGNTVTLQKTFGLRSQKTTDPIDAHTLFNIGPATQAITSLLAATFFTEREPLFDQPAHKLNPQFRLTDKLSQQNVTLRNLLTMTAGIPDYTDNILDPAWAKPEDVFAVISQSPIIAQPGQIYNYSNVSISSAGYLLAMLHHPNNDIYPSFVASATTQLFIPMGMTRATFSVNQAKASHNYASPHKKKQGAFSVAARWEPAVNSFAPAIGLKANLNDMIQWLITELQEGVTSNGQRVAPAFAVRERWKPQNTNNDIYAGMGWTRQVYQRTEIVANTGSYDRHTCSIGFMPQYRTGFIVLVNTNHPDAAKIIQTIALGLTEILISEK